MSGLERQQLIAALIAAATALFVMANTAPGLRWRRPLRGAALAVFAIALIAAVVEIGLWLAA